MRVRVIRWTDPLSSHVHLVVQRWCAGQWEPVGVNFELNQSEAAHDFTLKLSLTKRFPVEMAVFEDGNRLGIESVSARLAGESATFNYRQLTIPCDCCVATIEEALRQIGEEAKHVSSDVYVSDRWTPEDVSKLTAALQEYNSLANRVRIDRRLKPFEWYVECCGKCVGSNPPG